MKSNQHILWMLAAILTICGIMTLTSCSDDNDNVNIDGEQQQVNTADITTPATPAAVRMRLAGKME